MKNNRMELLDKIENRITFISDNKNASNEVKEELAKYRIYEGRVEEYFSDTADVLEDADIREVALLTEQIYLKTGDQELNPENWFTEFEMKEARQFDFLIEHDEDEITFPLTIENAVHVANDVYSVAMDVKTMAQLVRSKKLNYNTEIQRQPTRVKRKDQIILKPTVIKKNVKEIKDLLLKGQLVPTTLAFNAATSTSDTGEELTFDSKKRTLTINEGTRLDILDGYHRSLATEQAYSENPDLDFNFIVLITNYTTRQAQQYQAQLAKATPLATSRVKELEANSLSDTVVGILKSDSELRNRISSSSIKMNQSVGELVSYRVLADSIDREFPMKTKIDAREVGEYLTDFFDYLIGSFPETFIEFEDYDTSIMAYNKLFAGYVALAAEMKKLNMKPKEVKTILSNIDFNKSNPEWKKLNILNEDGKVNRKIKESDIGKYFKTLIKK